jgi:hypothetical protein
MSRAERPNLTVITTSPEALASPVDALQYAPTKARALAEVARILHYDAGHGGRGDVI